MEEERMASVSLPEDVLLEILFRTRNDPATLFRCATTCHPWRRLIADPAFLLRCWPSENERYSFVGFFAQKRHYLKRDAEDVPFFPAPRSAMGPGRRTLLSFFPSVPAGLLDNAEPLASRHGLLLVRLAFPNPIIAHLAVCNPLAGTCDLLPPLYWDYSSYKGYAILTATDCCSSGPQRPMTYFKVIVVDTGYSVYMISSDEASWSGTRVGQCLDGRAIQVYDSNAVVCRGTPHWLGYNRILSCLCTINVNAQTGRVSVTKLVTSPRQYDFQDSHNVPCLSIDGCGTLSMIWMQRTHFMVEIWKQQDNKEGIDEDDDTSKWHCTRVIQLKKPQKIAIQGRGSRILGEKLYMLGEKCGMLLVSCGQQVYAAHLETGIMEEVTDSPSGYISHMEARPFEIDWLTFFVSRLGGQ